MDKDKNKTCSSKLWKQKKIYNTKHKEKCVNSCETIKDQSDNIIEVKENSHSI